MNVINLFDRNAAVGEQEQIHPRENGGVLLEPPIPYELDVVKRRLLWQTDMEDIGHFERYEVTFDDGSRYQEQKSMPLNQAYDLGVSMTTPWWVRLSGYATEVQKELAKEGIASDLVGPPEFNFNFKSIFHFFDQVKMERDASVQMVLFKEAARSGLFSEEEMMATGYSRGAMMIWYLLAFEEAFGVNLAYFDSNDPCLTEAISASDVDLHDLDTYTYLPREILAGREAIRRHSKEDKWRLVKHHERGRHFLLQHLAVGASILDGQAGKPLPFIPKDKTGSVRLYDDSIGNQGDKLKAKLVGHPYIHVGDRRGLHASGMSPNVRRAAVGRIAIAQNYHKEQIPFGNKDLLKITYLQETA